MSETIFIFGMMRSGSTWLAKIFDSHPSVLYLHEPDIDDRGLDLLPVWFTECPSPADIDAAEAYLDRLLAARTLRTTGVRPFFPKHYRGRVAEHHRRSLIYLAKAMEKAGLLRNGRIPQIPDMADVTRGQPKCVIKSISALGRTEALIAATRTTLAPILLMRHPCAAIGSCLRGIQLGRFSPLATLGALLETRSARELGVDGSIERTANDVERIAWTWLLGNAEAYRSIEASRGLVVEYEDLARDPMNEVQKIFAYAKLDVAAETQTFIRRSTTRNGGFYSVFRDPDQARDRWRHELDASTIHQVRDIVTRHPVGQRFFQH